MNDSLNLRVGEWVEVRSADEVLATLDGSLSLEGLPFMPEMLSYCGKRFRVYKSAHKTCDTIGNYHIRRMRNAVHLEGQRCDGGAHGGCQAGCLTFWKEAWLRRVSGDRAAIRCDDSEASRALGILLRGTGRAVPEGEPIRYRCQATEMLRATTEVSRRERLDPRFYLKDLTSGNIGLGDWLRFGAFAILNAFLLRWFGRRYPHLRGRAGDKTPSAELQLQAGEIVEVRSRDEIMETLNRELRNRGLGFDVEMLPYCKKGRRRVLRRVDKIIDEKSGCMMKLPNPCLVLDGVTCSGKYSKNRMFCPRGVYPYWREVWLSRAAGEIHER